MNISSKHKPNRKSKYYDAYESFSDLIGPSESASMFIATKQLRKDSNATNSFELSARMDSQSTIFSSNRSNSHNSYKKKTTELLPPQLVHKKSTKPPNAQNFANVRLTQEIELVQGIKSKIWIIKFSPCCKYLAIAAETGIISIYDIIPPNSNSSQLISNIPRIIMAEHTKAITDISWNAQGFLISSSLDGTVKIWTKNQERSLFTLENFKRVYSVCFHPIYQDHFVTASDDRLIRVIKYPELTNEGLYQTSHKVTVLCYSPNAAFLAAGLEKGEVLIYKSKTGCRLRLKYKLKCKNRFGLRSFGRKVTSLQFMDEDYLLITTNDSRIRLFKFKEELMVQKYKGNINLKCPIRADLSFDKKFVICGSEDGLFYIWNSLRVFESRSPGKNGEYECVDVRGAKKSEFTCFAPEKVVKAVKKRFKNKTGQKIGHIIFSIGAQSNLKVFYSIL
ncbi:unnamed protein product [Blepharisma stoltei]|uniref:Uncharacterized protein n=1 Tax=Blepharisma stoltei TaxID=1481888 RepID=A0AAU9JMY7_9CILI|nr:unnamed protein product [Blepharisma stoltei]